MMGWLNIVLAIITTAITLIGLYRIIRQSKYYNDEKIKFNTLGLFFILLIIFLWVYISGVGGFWPQRADWHWRNAILRDLIDYSWPVIYPNTGNALAYYYNYFLIPALIGKAFGWSAANICLFVLTILGIFITTLLVISYIKTTDYKVMLGILVIFIVWGGFEGLRKSMFPLFGLNSALGYQLTPNNSLLQWVTNQTIIPWVAMAIFINDKRVENYVFLGMCVLASAPLPFVGFFIFVASDGIAQLVRKKDLYNWSKSVLSVQNLCALCIFFVYSLFFMCNTAATGSEEAGGFGLYVPLSSFFNDYHYVINIMTFFLFNFFIYTILLWKDYKCNLLFIIATISLILMPFFRVGTSYDFGMRAVIPAEFMYTVLIAQYMTKKNIITLRRVMLIGLISILTFSFAQECISRKIQLMNSDNKTFADRVETFSNKEITKEISINFLCENPYNKLFFKLTKEKSPTELEKDIEKSKEYLENRNYCISDGKYYINLLGNSKVNIAYDYNQMKVIANEVASEITIQSAYKDSYYEFYTGDINKYQWIIGENGSTDIGVGEHVWADFDFPDTQIFKIIEVGDGYCILSGSNALTYSDGNLHWADYKDTSEQKWEIRLLN